MDFPFYAFHQDFIGTAFRRVNSAQDRPAVGFVSFLEQIWVISHRSAPQIQHLLSPCTSNRIGCASSLTLNFGLYAFDAVSTSVVFSARSRNSNQNTQAPRDQQ